MIHGKCFRAVCAPLSEEISTKNDSSDLPENGNVQRMIIRSRGDKKSSSLCLTIRFYFIYFAEAILANCPFLSKDVVLQGSSSMIR